MGVAYLEPDTLVVIGGDESGGRIVTELGMTVIDTPGGRYSREEMPMLLAEADIVLTAEDLPISEGTQALFDSLPGVANGGHATISQIVGSATYQESSLSLRWAAPQVADALEAAAERVTG